MKQTNCRFFSCDNPVLDRYEINPSERILKRKIDQLLQPLKALGFANPFIRFNGSNKFMELIIAKDEVPDTQCKILKNYFNSFGGNAKTLKHPSGEQIIITFKSNQLGTIISNLSTLAFIELSDSGLSFNG